MLINHVCLLIVNFRKSLYQLFQNVKDVSESIMFYPISQLLIVMNLGKSHHVWVCNWAPLWFVHTDGSCSFRSSITSHTSLIIHPIKCTFEKQCIGSRVSDRGRVSLIKDRSTHVISVGHHRVDEQILSVTMRAMIHNLTYPLVYSNSLQWKIHIYNHFYKEIIEIYKLVIFHEYMVNYRRVWHGEISWNHSLCKVVSLRYKIV